GIEPAVVGSPRPPALKAGEPTRYPDTSAAEVSGSSWVILHGTPVEKRARGEEVREKSAGLDNRARHKATLRGSERHVHASSAVSKSSRGAPRKMPSSTPMASRGESRWQ